MSKEFILVKKLTILIRLFTKKTESIYIAFGFYFTL